MDEQIALVTLTKRTAKSLVVVIFLVRFPLSY